MWDIRERIWIYNSEGVGRGRERGGVRKTEREKPFSLSEWLYILLGETTHNFLCYQTNLHEVKKSLQSQMNSGV